MVKARGDWPLTGIAGMASWMPRLSWSTRGADRSRSPVLTGFTASAFPAQMLPKFPGSCGEHLRWIGCPAVGSSSGW